MVLLSDGCSGGEFIEVPFTNKILIVHHDIDSPVILPMTIEVTLLH